jgi:hypothetical protein
MRDGVKPMSLHDRLFQQCCAILTGHSPSIQSSVLADLTATLLAGHFAFNMENGEVLREKTEKMRKQLLRKHTKLIEQLVPVNESRLLAEQRENAH